MFIIIITLFCNQSKDIQPGDRGGRDRMVVGFTTTYAMQSVYITTDVVSSNLDQGEVYNIM
jgi:hypothetical protein